MKLFNKLDVARKVWAAVMKKYGTRLRKDARDVSIGAYCNGREQGYTVTAHFKGPGGCSNTAQFAEFRGSDDIVVYAGNITDDLMPCDQKDAIYTAKKFAPCENYEAAAKLVASALGLI